MSGVGARLRRRGAWASLVLAILLAADASPAAAPSGKLVVEIFSPATDLVRGPEERSIEVRGGASLFGGVRFLDLFLVLDTSRSLQKTDPSNHRSEGAVQLVRSLPEGAIRIGVVDFDAKARLVAPLTEDRAAVIRALRSLDQSGSTDLAAGISTALLGFDDVFRGDSSRVILLFTDGRSDDDAARRAMQVARHRGVAIHTLLLGSGGESILREIAKGTGGSFVRVTDPSKIPEAFLGLRTTGVEQVTLSVGGSVPIRTQLSGGTFRGTVPLQLGENRIVATALGRSGEAAEDTVTVTLREPGCAELQVQATRDGQPALSLSERAVEIVVDASNSMWGRMDGRPKMSVAQDTLLDVLEWLPDDLRVALRAYGHRDAHARRNCRDTELLVPFAKGGRGPIREAISGLRPRGQTPLGYSLAQVPGDFGRFRGERAVVLLTDGIESCDGDPVAAARALQDTGRIPVHVIGFGLTGEDGADAESLRAIAEASGGSFLTASSAEELRAALTDTVGTPFSVLRDDVEVGAGTLGGDHVLRLPKGEYTVRLESAPAYEVPVVLGSEERLTLRLKREQDELLRALDRAPASGYASCSAAPPDPLLAEPLPPRGESAAEPAALPDAFD